MMIKRIIMIGTLALLSLMPSFSWSYELLLCICNDTEQPQIYYNIQIDSQNLTPIILSEVLNKTPNVESCASHNIRDLKIPVIVVRSLQVGDITQTNLRFEGNVKFTYSTNAQGGHSITTTTGITSCH